MTWEVGIQLAFVGGAISFIMISDKISLNEERFPNVTGILKLMLVFMAFFLIGASIVANIPIIDTALQQNQTNITYATSLKTVNNGALYVVLVTSVILFGIMLLLYLIHLIYIWKETSERKEKYSHQEKE